MDFLLKKYYNINMNRKELKQWVIENLLDKRGLLNGTKLLLLFGEEGTKLLEDIIPIGKNIYEKIYFLLNDIVFVPICSECGKPTEFINTKKGFHKYCSKQCSGSSEEAISHRKKAFKDKYGVEYSILIPEVKEKREKVCRDNLKEIQEKRKKTFLKRFGTTNPLLNKEVQDKIKKTNLERYGVENVSSTQEIKDKLSKVWESKTKEEMKDIARKGRETSLINWGTENPAQSKEIQEKMEKTNLKRYGTKSPLESKEIQEKIKETLINTYGVDHPSKLESSRTKKRIRRLEEVSKIGQAMNYNLNSCKYLEELEKEINNFSGMYGTKSPGEFIIKELGYSLDYYNPDLKIIIEWDEEQHFKEKNITKDIKRHKDIQEYFKDFVIYRIREKEFLASGLSLKKYIDLLNTSIPYHYLKYQYSEENRIKEFRKILSLKGSLNSIPIYNKTTLTFQTDIFYKKENQMWQDEDIRKKLVLNRIYYLNAMLKEKKKTDYTSLTDKELLRGFKISGLHRTGFSHFSPLWIKWFIEEYNIKSIYDPCGGWGHRLLGSYNIDYHYNDIDPEVTENVKRISEFIKNNNKNIGNCSFTSFDSSEYIPEFKYEAVFTCPPYFNTEEYFNENTSSKKYLEYLGWLNIWWKQTVLNSIKNCEKYFCFIVSKKYKEDMKNICNECNLTFLREEGVSSSKVSHHFHKKFSNKNEYLVIFSKRD